MMQVAVHFCDFYSRKQAWFKYTSSFPSLQLFPNDVTGDEHKNAEAQQQEYSHGDDYSQKERVQGGHH